MKSRFLTNNITILVDVSSVQHKVMYEKYFRQMISTAFLAHTHPFVKIFHYRFAKMGVEFY